MPPPPHAEPPQQERAQPSPPTQAQLQPPPQPPLSQAAPLSPLPEVRTPPRAAGGGAQASGGPDPGGGAPARASTPSTTGASSTHGTGPAGAASAAAEPASHPPAEDGAEPRAQLGWDDVLDERGRLRRKPSSTELLVSAPPWRTQPERGVPLPGYAAASSEVASMLASTPLGAGEERPARASDPARDSTSTGLVSLTAERRTKSRPSRPRKVLVAPSTEEWVVRARPSAAPSSLHRSSQQYL